VGENPNASFQIQASPTIVEDGSLVTLGSPGLEEVEDNSDCHPSFDLQKM
jgi:hypothetical protein